MSSTGLKIPTTANVIKGTWNSSGNITSDDDALASTVPINNDSSVIEGQTINGGIPGDRTITQVVVECEIKYSGAALGYNAYLQTWSYIGTQYTSNTITSTPTSITKFTFDITADRAWVPADFDDKTWIRLSFNRTSIAGVTCYCDYVGITVTYVKHNFLSNSVSGTGTITRRLKVGQSELATITPQAIEHAKTITPDVVTVTGMPTRINKAKPVLEAVSMCLSTSFRYMRGVKTQLTSVVAGCKKTYKHYFGLASVSGSVLFSKRAVNLALGKFVFVINVLSTLFSLGKVDRTLTVDRQDRAISPQAENRLLTVPKNDKSITP